MRQAAEQRKRIESLTAEESEQQRGEDEEDCDPDFSRKKMEIHLKNDRKSDG